MFGTFATCALVAALSHTGAIDVQIRTAPPPAPGATSIAADPGTAIALPDALSSSSEDPAPIAAQADLARLSQPSVTAPAEGAARRSPALIGLYASFVTLEALDVHSTLRAISKGGAEGNPAMRGVVTNEASFVAMKAATGGLVIWLSEKMRKRHPALAIAVMAGLNSAMATIVARNYSLY